MTAVLQFTETVDLVRVSIGLNDQGCGHTFYMTRDHYNNTRQHKQGWWCPVCGCARAWTGETEAEKLKKQLASAERQAAWHKDNARHEREARELTQRRLNATKGAKTKLQKRIKNGVCPCCTRSFMNLKAHMATKHPDFQATSE